MLTQYQTECIDWLIWANQRRAERAGIESDQYKSKEFASSVSMAASIYQRAVEELKELKSDLNKTASEEKKEQTLMEHIFGPNHKP